MALPMLASHLRQCTSCAEQYVQFIFERTRRTLTAPDEIWPRIHANLNCEVEVSANRFLWVIAGRAVLFVGVVGLLLLTSYVVLKYRSPAASIDLSRYISILEKSSAGPSADNVQQAFAELIPYDRKAALRETGLHSQVEKYGLADQRAMSSKDGNIFEFTYQSGVDSFVLFVAPRAVKLGFGRYHLASTEFSGLHCQWVQCPRQDIFWATTEHSQYVFLRKRTLVDPSEDLFRELIERP